MPFAPVGPPCPTIFTASLIKPLSYEILCCKNQSHDSVFQPSENLCFENFSPGPTMVGPIVETGYERMFNTLKVSNTTNDSHVCPFFPLSDR